MSILYVGDIAIPTLAALDVDQTYEHLGGESIFRAADGSGIAQRTWSRTRITTTGSGWIPAGLEALPTTPIELRCIVPQAVTLPAGVMSATLPATRRSDDGHAPWAMALLPGGRQLPAALALSGDVATVTAVPGAVAYQVNFYPKFTVIALRPRRAGRRGDATFSWELVCEER